MELVVAAVAVYATPAIETLLRTDSYKAAGGFGAFALVQPAREPALKFVIPHLRVVEVEILCGIAVFGHRPDPCLAHALIPRAPVLLEHGGAGRDLERYADAVHVQYIGVGCQSAVYVFDGFPVLNLVVHVENAYLAFQTVAPDVVDAEVEQHAAVLAARKGDVYVVEQIEDGFEPYLGCLIDGYRISGHNFRAAFSCIASTLLRD